MTSRVLTVMFTDIKGFTDRTSKTSREQLLSLLDAHEQLLLPIAHKFNGHLVKTLGDSLLLTFESPTNAVLCAMLMQEKLREYNIQQNEEDLINVRIAINSGEVEERKGDIFGEAVNIAARIEGITDADEIYFTESVYLAMNKAEVPSSEVGKRRLKGIPEAIKVYRVIQDPNSSDYQTLLQSLKNNSTSTQGNANPTVNTIKENRQVIKPWWFAALAALLLIMIGLVTFDIFDPLAKPLQQVEVAIKEKSFGLAYSRADKLYEQYPDDERVHHVTYLITEAQNGHLIVTEQFDKAIETIKSVKKIRPHINLDELHKQTVWKMVQTYYPTNPFVRTKLSALLKNHPDDAQLLKNIIALMGQGTSKGPSNQALSAAILLAKHHKIEMTEQEGLTLLEAMSYESAEREQAAKLRKLVATRYKTGFEQAVIWLDKGIGDERLNSYLLLDEYAELTEHQRFIYHIRNIEQLFTADRQFLYQSIGWLNEHKKNWLSFVKNTAPLNNIKVFNSLHNMDSTPEFKQLAALLSTELLPLVEPMLFDWLDNERIAYRVNAFHILNNSHSADKIDLNKYHKLNLTEFDASYTPRAFRAAIAYFSNKGQLDILQNAKSIHLSYNDFGRSPFNAELIQKALNSDK